MRGHDKGTVTHTGKHDSTHDATQELLRRLFVTCPRGLHRCSLVQAKCPAKAVLNLSVRATRLVGKHTPDKAGGVAFDIFSVEPAKGGDYKW